MAQSNIPMFTRRVDYILDTAMCALSLKTHVLKMRDEFLGRQDSRNWQIMERFLDERPLCDTDSSRLTTISFYIEPKIGRKLYKVRIAPQPENDLAPAKSPNLSIRSNNSSRRSSIRSVNSSKRSTPNVFYKVLIQEYTYHVLHVLEGCPTEDFCAEKKINAFFYFIRALATELPKPKTPEEANTQMPGHFITGYMNKPDFLRSLSPIMDNVFTPMLSYFSQQDHLESQDNVHVARTSLETVNARTGGEIRDEFNVSLYRFHVMLNDTNDALTGSFKLPMPEEWKEMEIIPDSQRIPQRVARAVEATMRDWNHRISRAVKTLKKKQPDGNSPLEEVRFWRYRNNVLTSILEQLRLKPAQVVLKLWKRISGRDYERRDVQALLTEAKDNLRFMVLVERHFKNLVFGLNFQVVIDTIPPMMSSLRFIWIISRSYNKDELMGPLMKRIVWALIDRMTRVLEVKSLFKQKVDAIMFQTQQAIETINLWKKTYFQERAIVEQSSRDNRWEFDRVELFGKTDHLASVFQDFYDIASRAHGFYSLFGPELKSITGKGKNLDELTREIDKLFDFIQSEDFSIDPLQQKQETEWEAVCSRIRFRLSEIESMAIRYVNDYFRNMRSVKEAFNLLGQLKQLKPHKAIQDLIEQKYEDICYGFRSEMKLMMQTFNEHKDKTPFHYAPPTGGNTAWVRHIITTMRTQIQRFSDSKSDVFQTEIGSQLREEYLSFGRTLRDYEQSRHYQWYELVSQTLPDMLRRSVFIVATAVNEPTDETNRPPTRVSTLTYLGKPSNVACFLPKYEVNFDTQMNDFFSDARYCENLGLEVPELLRTVALQEKKYSQLRVALSEVVTKYNDIIDRLDVGMTNLLEEHIGKLHNVMIRGTQFVSWNSLVIKEFIKECSVIIKDVDGKMNELKIVEDGIAASLAKMESVNLFKMSKLHKKGNYPTVKDYLEFAEAKRMHDMIIVGRQRMLEISNYLEKMEEIVFQTKTGRCPRLTHYYQKYEMKIFNILLRMLMKNITQFIMKFGSDFSLFCVDVKLAACDVVTFPLPIDIHKWIHQTLRDCVDCTKYVIRWKAGTCQPCPSIKIPKQDEPFVYSYRLDLERSLVVRDAIASFTPRAHRVMKRVNHAMQRILQHRKFWRLDKANVVEKWAASDPSPLAYEDYIIGLEEKYQEIKSAAVDGNEMKVGSIVLRFHSFFQSIKTHRRQWLHLYLRHLREGALQKAKTILIKIDEYAEVMEKIPETLDELKVFLTNIHEITSGMTELVDETMSDIGERYRIIHLYGDEEFLESMIPNECEAAKVINLKWQSVLTKTRINVKEIGPAKEKFAMQIRRDMKSFKGVIRKFVQRFQKSGPGVQTDNLEDGLELLNSFSKEYEELEKTRRDFVNAEYLLDLQISHLKEMKQVGDELDDLKRIYLIYANQMKARDSWSLNLWSDLNVKEMAKIIDGFLQDIYSLPKNVRVCPAGRAVERNINDFKSTIPLLEDLKHEALRERHWKTLMQETGISFQMDKNTFTLQNVFAMELHRYQETIDVIVGNAIRELSIENTLAELEESWRHNKFHVIPHSRGTTVSGYVIGEVEELREQLDDNMITLQGMSGSRFVQPFVETVRKWEKLLSLVYEVFEELLVVQRKWVYLEAIFIGGDIKMQLPKEAQQFQSIDRSFKKMMTEIYNVPNILKACQQDKRYQQLQDYNSKLDWCQKALNNYLHSKRNAFPRFFFISDDELLSILGTSNPEGVQEHIIKMFDNIIQLVFTNDIDENVCVVGMRSTEGEQMMFRQSIFAFGKLEEWLSDTVDQMRESNRFLTKEALYYYRWKKTRVEWMFDYQGMMVLAANQIWFTWEVEDTFRKIKSGKRSAMKDFFKAQKDQLNDIVIRVRSPLSKNDLKKLETVLIIDIHSRDIVDYFVRNSVSAVEEFEWESQLRFYWQLSEDGVMVRQCNGEFRYGYEYMGLNGRLVVTPLTDRIYLTLTQALTMHLGGAPEGPAGTGKTETCKDLAKAMGLLCVVTNCGEGMDYQSIGKLLSGLCQCGAWGCFDEFNRIDLSVLSVVSTQVHTIQNALAKGYTHFNLEDSELILDSRVGLFITMNPGYAGRTELPESIKALFRPVVVIVPDLLQICEVMLYSQGFLSAKILARKMTTMYKVAMEQMSKQYHYDFGLRALKSVLVMAGSIRRNNPDYSEEMLLMRALRDMNVPKFVNDDVTLFHGLIHDLFPNVECPQVVDTSLVKAIEEVLAEKQYSLVEKQIDKVVQFHDTMKTRHSTMVVGPTCGGKTVVIKTMVEALHKMGSSTRMYRMDPKERDVSELYGTLDPDSRDWSDGLLSHLFRVMNNPSECVENTFRCIIFDGDVDALWIENMNSVMDDNRLLTLINGERIRLQPQCYMVFEVSDLQYASPATVSRCGMVYVDPRDLTYHSLWERWLRNRTENEKQMLSKCYTKYIPCLMDAIFEGIMQGHPSKPMKTAVFQSPINVITQLCTMLDSLIMEDSKITDCDLMEAYFINAIINSAGVVLHESEIEKFHQFLFQTANLSMDIAAKDDSAVYGCLPNKKCLSEYVFEETQQRWIPWDDLIPEYTHDRNLRFASILVPTADTVRIMWLLKCHWKIKKPLVLIGNTGTSKTASVSQFLSEMDTETNCHLLINCTSRTSSFDLQRTLENQTEKRTKDSYGPPPGKHLVVFIDDLSMPQKDDYGTQQPIAFLRQLIENGYIYDRSKDLDIRYMRDLIFIAAMGKPGGGRQHVDPRMISHFSVMFCRQPSDESLYRIFSSILKGHLIPFQEKVMNLVDNVVKMTIELYKHIKEAILPTPLKFHYVYNIRDIRSLFQGLSLSSADVFTREDQFLRLWYHECRRCLSDRMISEEDISVVKMKSVDLLDTHYKDKIVSYVTREPLMFGDYSTAMEEGSPRVYEDVLDFTALKAIFAEVQVEYNNSHPRSLDLVLFNDALDQISRLHRVLRLNKGHLLVVGIPGCGKTSLITLAAFAAGTEIFEIKLKRNYKEKEFREDLKSLYRKIVERRSPILFVMDDQEISSDAFLDLINTMLANGTVPALFTDDEWSEISTALQTTAGEAGYVCSFEGIQQYFACLTADNLHIALTMSPGGDSLRCRCRNFPAIINNTTITWFQPWPKQALLAVAGHVISFENPLIPFEHWQSIVNQIVYTHENVEKISKEFKTKLRRENYITPTHYIDFITTYKSLLQTKAEDMDRQITRLSNGLSKLQVTRKEIDLLNRQVEEQKYVVEEKTIACESLMKEIETATDSANRAKKIVTEKTEDIKVRTKEIEKEKMEAEEVLAEALPAVEVARAALSELEKNDVTEMRAFATPPKAVQSVGEMLCHVFQSSDISWKSARGIMADANFISTLQHMDVEAIPSRCINGIRDIIRQKGVKLEDVRAASKAGAGIMKFVLAVLSFYNVAKEVRPKRERVRLLERDMLKAEKELNRANKTLQDLEDQLKYLQDRCDATQSDMDRLRQEMITMKRRLQAAEQLTNGLSSEEIRWSVELAGLKERRKNLIGDCVLAAGFLCYLGPFTWEYRKQMLYDDWVLNILQTNIPHSVDFRVENLLSSEVEISKWNSEGLPADELSIQNGILSLCGSRFPLCIDPHQQALSWIKRAGQEDGKNIRISTFENDHFVRSLENSVKYGNYFLFENCGIDIDPVIDGVLTRSIIKDKGRQVVILADKEVDWDDRFRLFLTTKIGNPNFVPKIFTKTLVINYTVTLKGLEDQLLCVLVRMERKDIEEMREQLIHDMSVNKRMLKEFEDRLLLELATQTGNILDNQELIDTLEETKKKAVQVKKQLEETLKMAKAIEIQRDAFRPAAKRGALLFFILADLAVINPMYQFSLSAYLSVFCNAIKKSTASFTLEKRQQNIVKTLTYNVYCYGCTGIFERHKLFFSFLLTSKMLMDRGTLKQHEFEFFVKGNTSVIANEEDRLLDWLTEDNCKDLQLLQKVIPTFFSSIMKSMKKRKKEWKAWYDHETPERQPYPSKYARLKAFYSLCLLRCLRVDRVCNATVAYITKILGEQYVTPPILNFRSVFDNSSCLIPVIFVLSPGSDPASELITLAGNIKFSISRIKVLSLGQGQEPNAESMLTMSMAHGYWLILQNCHLLIPWLSHIESTLVEGIKCHPDFRLWLTTEPTKNFPIGLLQKSYKVVTEPPTGLKLNLNATYDRLTNTQLIECPHPAFRPLVFALAFLHAVLQERRHYGKIGWNICYEFNESDFSVSYRILQTYMTKAWVSHQAGEETSIPWNNLKFLIGEVMYGGRVTDSYDRRVLKTYMSEYFGDFLFDDCQLFSFYENEAQNLYYYIPEEIPYQAIAKHTYTEYILNLPLIQTPEALGLHANAVIGYNTRMARDIWSWMIELMPRTSESSDDSTSNSDEKIKDTAEDILDVIPAPYDIKELRRKTKIVDPVREVLYQELERFNIMCEKMMKTLQNLIKAIAGEHSMSTELEDVGNALYNGQLPECWRRLTPETRKSLGNWMKFFSRRKTQYDVWIECNDLICIWLSGLHIPESYLTALIQQACRRNAWALDKCVLVAKVTDHDNYRQLSTKPEFGCNIYGMFIEGAAWSTTKQEIERQQPKQLIQEMPVVRLTPTEVHRVKLAETLRVPVYVTSQRRNAMGIGHVFDIDLRTSVHKSHWILQGIALLLNEDQ